MATIEIRGQITDVLTKTGISSCLIKLFVIIDNETTDSGLSATTIDDGSFLLSGNLSDIPEGDYYLFVTTTKQGYESTRSDLIKANTFTNTIFKIIMRIMAASSGTGNMMVYGLIESSQGEPQADLTVTAYDKSVAELTELGRTITGANGDYIIVYSFPPENVSKTNPDLIVQVKDPASEDKIVATSPLFLSAKPKMQVNLTVDESYAGISSFQALETKLTNDSELQSILFSSELSSETKITNLKGLGSQEIAYLANKTGLSTFTLSVYFKSVFINLMMELESDVNNELLFALFSSLGNSDAETLFFSRNGVLLDLIKDNISRNIITNYPDTTSQSYIASLKTNLIDYLARSTDTQIAIMFSDTGISTLVAKRSVLACITDFLEKDYDAQIVSDFISDVRNKVGNPASLTTQMVDKLDFFFTVFRIINSILLVDKLFANDIISIETLIQNTSELNAIIGNSPGDLPSGYSTVDEYVADILIKINEQFPEEVFVNTVINETEISLRGLKEFFNQNGEFRYLNDTIDNLIESQQPQLGGLSEEQRNALKEDLEKLQRFTALTFAEERYEAIKTLFKSGYSSSADIINAGEKTFVDNFAAGFTGGETLTTTAGTYIYRLAFLNAFIAMNTWANLGNQVTSVLPGILKPDSQDSINQSSGGLPSLATLFGRNDAYRCPSERSVFSAAAYLVDLLQFKISAGSEQSVADVSTIFNRRPDISQLLLDKSNTITRLPYIDLVNEIFDPEQPFTQSHGAINYICHGTCQCSTLFPPAPPQKPKRTSS